MGWVEEDAIDSYTFDEQFHTFQSFGYARDPALGSGLRYKPLVGDAQAAAELKGMFSKLFSKI